LLGEAILGLNLQEKTARLKNISVFADNLFRLLRCHE